MKPLMPPIDTPDRVFHDGDPSTGELGTICSAEWLNNVQDNIRNIQAECIAILKATGFTPDDTKDGQLWEAIQAAIKSQVPAASLTTSGITQLSSSVTSDSETIASTLKAVKIAMDNASARMAKDRNGADIPNKALFRQNLELGNSATLNTGTTADTVAAGDDSRIAGAMQKGQNGADIPDKDLFVRNTGSARAFNSGINIGGTSGVWTTADFIVWLESQGAFNHPYWVCKGSWSYANNKTITDTGCGDIDLTGAVVEVMGLRDVMTIRVTTPTTTGGTGLASAQFTYINHGNDYAPGWRRDYNTINPPPQQAMPTIPDALVRGNNLSDVPDKTAGVRNLGLTEAVKQALNAVQKNGDTMSAPLINTHPDAFRLKQPNRSFFWRFDGSTLYLLRTALNDPNGGWDAARPLYVNADSGQLYLGPDTIVNGTLYVGRARIATDGNIYGTRWNANGAWLWDTIAEQLTARDNNINTRATRGWVSQSFVNDITLGVEVYHSPGSNVVSWICHAPAGHVFTGINISDTGSNSADNVNGVYYKPIQKRVNGVLMTIAG